MTKIIWWVYIIFPVHFLNKSLSVKNAKKKKKVINVFPHVRITYLIEFMSFLVFYITFTNTNIDLLKNLRLEPV